MMRARNVVSLVVGSIMALVAIGVLLAGASLGVAAAVERDDDGYFDVTLDRIRTDTAVLVSDDVTLETDDEAPWLLDVLDTDIRLRVSGADTGQDVFVGVARQSDVDAYLDGVARTDVTDVDGSAPELRTREGSGTLRPPTDETLWTVSSSGTGVQEIEWQARTGRWAVVVMNSDASPGVAVDVEAGIRSGLVIPLAIALATGGLLLLVAAVVLIATGARTPADHRSGEARGSPGADGPSTMPPPPPPGEPGEAFPPPSPTRPPVTTASPVHYSATLDDDLSRWMWLVKWILAIPHFIVLVFLWIAFVASTVVAWFAIVVTRTYPRAIFDLNVGILRWTWRVSHYASSGGLGTDRYPPFTLAARPDDAVHLDVDYPTELSRWLPFVKLLFAIPHLVIVGLLSGPTIRWIGDDGAAAFPLGPGGGLLGLLVVIAGVILLVRGTYPAALYDLVAGFNRWILRVIAYVALMTDTYPPFRLDQGPDDIARYTS